MILIQMGNGGIWGWDAFSPSNRFFLSGLGWVGQRECGGGDGLLFWL
jgi:hypothetical protein